MINPQLSDYINKAHQAGSNNEQIRTELLKAGWQEADLNEALSPAPQTLAQIQKPSRVLLIAVVAGAILFIGAATVVAIRYFSKSNVEDKAGVPVTELPSNAPNNTEPETVPTVLPKETPTTTEPLVSPDSSALTYHNAESKYSVSYLSNFEVLDKNNKDFNIYTHGYQVVENNVYIVHLPVTSKPDPESISIGPIPETEKNIAKGYSHTGYLDHVRQIIPMFMKEGSSLQEKKVTVTKQKIEATQFEFDDKYFQSVKNIWTYFEFNNTIFAVNTASKLDEQHIKDYSDILSAMSFD